MLQYVKNACTQMNLCTVQRVSLMRIHTPANFGTDLSSMANYVYNTASSDPGSHILKDIQAENSESTGIYDEIY